MKEIIKKTSLTQEVLVKSEHLAKNVGSGTVNVYATPMMIALMENTAMKCLATFLDEGETSVGVSMNTTHDAPTPLDMKVKVTATIVDIDRKKVIFHIIAEDEKEKIGEAKHERFVVMKEKFETKAEQKRD